MAPPVTCVCGECQKCKRREYMRNWYKQRDNAERQRESQLKSRERRKDYVLEYDRQRGIRIYDVEKTKARAITNHAISTGKLERPDKCEKCGEEGRRGHDGRSLIQAHHNDYSKPLEVEWICTKCHGKEHRRF